MSLVSYFQGVSEEAKQIKWPTRRQTILYTTTVVTLSAFTAAYLGLLDVGFSKLIEKLIEIAAL